jgi:type IV secretion system protein VirB10
MNCFYALILAAVSTASAAEIPAGTHLLLRMEHSVSSGTAKAGDGVHLRTITPVSVDGRILLPVGTWVSGTIQRVERRGRLHGPGRLEIGLETLLLPTGLVVSVSPLVAIAAKSDFNTNRNRGGDGHGLLVTGAGLLAGYGSAGIASIWSHDEETAVGIGLSVGVATMVATAILTRNRDVEFSTGATLDVVFDHPIKVD